MGFVRTARTVGGSMRARIHLARRQDAGRPGASDRGSVDGLVWDELAADDEVDVPADNHKWLSDNAAYYRNAIRKVTGNGDCFPLRGKPNARYKVTAKDGKLTLEPSGLLLIVK